MAVDYAGTKPGLPTSNVEEPKYLHMKCKKQECPSIRVLEVTPSHGFPSGSHMYQCVECKTSWAISVGGGINL